MTFTQLISFRTHDIDAVRRITDDWHAATEGRRTARGECLFADRADPGRYVVAVDFDSAEAAAVNAALPETQRAAEQMAAVTTDLTYTDLDLVEHRDSAAVAS